MPDKRPVLGGDDIVELMVNRLKVYSDRNGWYQTLESYYYGPDGPSTFGPSIKAMNSQGRPQLRDGELGGAIDRPHRFSSRRLSGVADDYAALKGRMPISRAEPPTPDDAGKEKAERLTKYLYSTYELSHLALQQPDSGRNLSVLGDSVYLLEPGTEGDADGRVVWTVIHPGICYPSFRHGFMRYDMYDLAMVEVWNPTDIRLSFGINVRDDAPEEDRRVTTYISPYQRTVLVGTDRWKIVKHAEWDLGFCPAQWVFNKPGHQMGQSDISNALDQQDLLDHALNVWADGIVYMTYETPVIKDPLNQSQDGIVIGPGAPPILVGPQGGASMLGTSGNPAALEQIIGQTIADMNAATGSSQVRQEGQMHGSIQTGRAIQAAQGPASTRIEAFHESFAAAWRELNAKTLRMQEKAPVLRDWSGPIYGRLKGVSFKDEMSAKDIEGWYRTTVTWESLVGLNPQQKLQIAYEGNVAKLWDKPYAMEMVGVEDPLGMLERVHQEADHEIELEAKRQQGASGQAGSSAGTSGTKSGLGGQTAGSQPAPMIARPFGMMQQSGGSTPMSGGPMGVTRKQVEQALSDIHPKLKGEVYAIGELALAGQSAQGQLAITSASDHRKVMEAVKPLGITKVRHIADDQMPAEAVKVA